MTLTEISEGILPDDIAALLTVVARTTADWTLTRRQDRYNLTVRWQPSAGTQQILTSKPKKRMSKARQARNHRRLQAFIDRKKEPVETSATTPENGDTALESDAGSTSEDSDSEADSTTTEESGNTAPPPREEAVNQETPVRPKPEAASRPPVTWSTSPITITHLEGPACKGAEGRSSPQASPAGTDRPQRRRVEKVTFDLPQKTYILKMREKEEFALASESSLVIFKIVNSTSNAKLYEDILRSHNHWMDARDDRNFVYRPDRLKHIETLCRKYGLDFDPL